MIWVLFAIGASIVNALYYMCLQNIQLKPRVFMIYRGMIVALMVTPFLLFYQMLSAWQFYLISFIQGLIVACLDLRLFKANKQYGAETVSSITPITVAAVFMIWCLVDPMIIVKYAGNPLKSAFIMLSLCGIIFAMMKYRKVKFTKDAVIFLIPVIVLDAICSVLNKTIMAYSEDSLYGLCYWRIFITSLIVGIVHLVFYLREKDSVKELIDCNNLKKTYFFALMPMSMLFRNMGMYYAENPSYVSALVYTSLLWIIFFNRHIHFIHFNRVYMQMDKKWAMVMLISVIILILATS